MDKQHKLLRVVTFDNYQNPDDFDGNGMKIFKSFDIDNDDEKGINKNIINVKFNELSQFKTEKDFYDYIVSFLDNNKTTISTLIIQCDPIPNTPHKQQLFTHYLHAQYLIEKANSQSIKPNTTKNTEENNTAKNIIFLIYMIRKNPYPLLFNQNWKHLYCDALSISNHSLFPEIQINDINIFDSKDKTKLLDRVRVHSGRIIRNNYIASLNKIDLSDGLHTELEKFKNLLDDRGRFYRILIQRISRVLEDIETGAETCILDTFKQILNKQQSKNQAKLDNRGSLRSLVMQQLGKKIESELVHVLSVIFSNGNSYLYKKEYDVDKSDQMEEKKDDIDVEQNDQEKDKEDKEDKDEDKDDDKYEDYDEEEVNDTKQKTKSEFVNRLWLDLLSEPQIVRFKAKSYGGKLDTKTPINNDITAKFPFSSYIHDYFMSLRKSVIANYQNEAIPIDESGLFGQRFLLKELSQRLNDANMKFPITNSPETSVKDLLSDIVKLESIRLGIKSSSGKQSEDLYNSIVLFLWQISLKLHEEYLGIKRKQKKQKAKVSKLQRRQSLLGIDDENNLEIDVHDYDEAQMEDVSDTEIAIDSDDDSDDEDDEEDDGAKEEKEEQYDEQLTVQVHEIYASVWSNEKITFQFIDVLSCINPIYLRKINKVWRNQRIPFIDCFGQIMQKVLKQLKELLVNLSPQELKPKADQILSIVGSFDGIFEYLKKMGYDETDTLIIIWKRIHLSLICTAVCVSDKDDDDTKAMDGQFVKSIYNKFQTFDNIEDLKWLINEIKTKLEANITD